MSQQTLADLCELSVDQISNIERGKSWTGEVSLALLASAFNVSQQALLDYTENKAFLENGGGTWRAKRSGSPRVTHRKIRITVPKDKRE